VYPWRRILIPTDFSTASQWVFDDAIRLAGGSGAEIVILHIRMTRTSRPDELRFPADESVFEYAERIELEKLRDRVRHANATIPTRLLVRKAPDPGGEISRTAAEEDIDLVVMSTHARHHVAHLIIGSTTMSVVMNAQSPVLAIRYGTHARRSMHRIVVPAHTKQHSRAAFDLAAAIARRESGEVHIVTICADEERTAATALQNELAASLSDVNVKQTIAVGKNVEEEVVRYTEKNDADAIFLNASDAPSPLKLDIIRSAPVPVMIVPGGAGGW
jgi:nucleotide-binding universal stress UspA family protein